MKVSTILAIGAALASMMVADVSVTVYLPCGQTPLEPVDPNFPHVYRAIMVGTRLELLVISGAHGPWQGGLLMMWDDWERGTLSCRELDPNDPLGDCGGSILEAAGERSVASPYRDADRVGFDLLAHKSAGAGDWFVLDYHAEQLGLCDVGLYDLVVDFNTPMEILSFTHVPSRDYNGDTIINFEDFALLASVWHEPADPQVRPATSFDLHGDAHIDPLDLALFNEFWLQCTDCNEPDTEPTPAFGWIGGG